MPTKRKNAHPGYWPVILGRRKPEAPRKRSSLSRAIGRFGGTRIVKVGDHYEVPSLDRGSWFDSRAEAQRFIKAVKRNPKRKRNIEIGLPKNKWINAKIRVTSGGKAQALVSESVLGHAKAGGSVSLNPKRKRRAAKKRKR